MRNKLELLAKGEIGTNENFPIVEPAYIEQQIAGNEPFIGQFTIRGNQQRLIKGIVYSNSPIVYIQETSFSSEEATITYKVFPKGLEIDGFLKTTIYIDTDSGVINLPCHFILEDAKTQTVEGMPKSLEELVSMAKDWPIGAQMVFALPEFKNQDFMNEGKLRLYYEALEQEVLPEYFLEEFLIATKLKKPAMFEIEGNPKLEKNHGYFLVRQTNWGSLQVEVKTNSPFVELEQELLEFGQESTILVSYKVDRTKLHAGKNIARISLISSYCSRQVDVTIFKSKSVEHTGKREMIELIKTDIQFLESIWKDKREYKEYLTDERYKLLLDKLYEKFDSINEKNELFYRLVKLCICISKDKQEQLLEQLRPYKSSIGIDRAKKPLNYALYLISMVILGQEDSGKELEVLKDALVSNDSKSLLFILALHVNPKFREDEVFIYEWAKNLYYSEHKSRYFIAIASQCVLKNPKIFTEMKEFEIGVLKYLLNHEWLTKEIVESAVRFNNAGKKFRPILYTVYEKIYEKYPLKEIVNNVCELLIRSDCQDSEYFVWYQRGVEENSRTTRLFDYYLYSLPKGWNHKFPRNLILYYSYEELVDKEIEKLVYKNIVEFYRQDTQIYPKYEEAIKAYVHRSFQLEKPDPELVKIYDQVIDIEILDAVQARKMYELTFTHKITCTNEEITSLICYTQDKKVEYPFRKGTVYLPIFEKNYIFIFKDYRNHLFVETLYNDELIYENNSVKEACELLIPEHPVVMNRYLNQISDKEFFTKEDLTLFEQYINDEEISKSLRTKLLYNCIQYYLQNEDEELNLQQFIKSESLIKGKKRAEFMNMLILHKYYAEVFEFIKENGYESLDAQTLWKMCRNLVHFMDISKEPIVIKLIYWLFEKGYTDKQLLGYLAQYYQGSVQSTYQLVMACHKEGVPCEVMTKNLLEQMLFSSVFEGIDEIYSYCKEDKSLTELTKSAYLAVKAHYYVLGVTDLSDELYEDLLNLLEINSLTVVKLALLRYYSDKTHLDDKELERMNELLDFIKRKKIRLLFIEKAAVRLGRPGVMLIESNVHSEEQVMVRYKISGSNQVYTEEMEKSYGGIFVKEIILYADETVTFEVFTDNEEKKELKHATCPMFLKYGADRYAALNKIAANLDREDLFREYAKTKKIVDKNYRLI
ncbi:hypothetical protein P261_01594 [Lachnospiraceae bacterium TWA4]|nr:hypothetical protein P261_01594 [Lachnospiraceae bacterium TWA4]